MKYLYYYDGLGANDRIEAPKDSFMSKAADRDLWFSKAKAKTLLPLVSPFLEAPLEDFCDLWGADFRVYNTACILDSQIYGLGVAGELRKTYSELMKEKNVLSIDDSNTLLRDIIDGSDAPFVYEKLGVRFDHFLLDEFQDTSTVQWTNFSPLLHNSEAQGGENLIVGDVKQSIYRWRGSDWSLLDKTVPGEFEQSSEVVLKDNWRSRPNVVRFNNAFFKDASAVIDRMKGHEGGDGPLSRIYRDVEQNVARSEGPSGSVSVTFCPKEDELQKVLDSVEEALAHGAVLSDIAVLVRSNAIGEDVAAFLIDNGIAVITDDSLKVKGSVTVRRLVSLMSFADNPEDTVNGYLADSLDVSVPDSCSSLIDMAESLLRSIKESDKEGLWKGEILHIQSFMDYLQDYVSTKGNRLRGFLRYWEGENPSIASPSSGNSVRVMTIHKSKGLDFPYVIIPFAENINLYKAGDCWCAPELSGTPLEGVADGVYDVTLSGSSESTLFAEHYRNESFLQAVDNINTLYVAMTRPVAGMHLIAKTPSDKFMASMEKGDLGGITDFSQILYRFVSEVFSDAVRKDVEGAVRFDYGVMSGFSECREEGGNEVRTFAVEDGYEYPSWPLNPELLSEDGEVLDVFERGRLRMSADARDFFSDEGGVGIAASNRIRGIILHDILSRVDDPEDLRDSVRHSLQAGEISGEEARETEDFLRERIESVKDYGWFGTEGAEVMNEVSLIDTDGAVYRPDRVVVSDGKVRIVDYKFGEHYRKYEHQLKKYAELWRRMGYADVSACLWYVRTGEVVSV